MLKTPTFGTAKWEFHRSVPLLIHVQARKNIEIAYYIVLQGDVTIVSYGTHIMIPVTIGSVPIQDLNNPESRPCSAPSYESCMYGAGMSLKNDKESKGEIFNTDEKTFVPVYPYFKDFSIE